MNENKVLVTYKNFIIKFLLAKFRFHLDLILWEKFVFFLKREVK